ncbi:3'-5' exonuclease [Escherichia coli]
MGEKTGRSGRDDGRGGRNGKMTQHPVRKIRHAPTAEQQAVINWQGQRLVVRAFADTGKTATLVAYAQARPERRMLYIAFNRSVREEAQARFPVNVCCRTAHQLAWPEFGRHYSHRLVPSLGITDIAGALSLRQWPLAAAVRETLQAFMNSADTTLSEVHVRARPPLRAAEVLPLAVRLWQRMCDRSDDFPVVHDLYLKLYQLSQPDLSAKYDEILFDEAQDASPVISDLVLRHRGTLVMVGDPHQQIYRFRGAVDALNTPSLATADRLWLTGSFRFGPCVADVANAVLALDGETKKVCGLGGDDRLLLKPERNMPHCAVLCRTVMGVIGAALHAARRKQKTYWINGMNAWPVARLLDLWWFSVGMTEKIREPARFAAWESFSDYEATAKASRDAEMLQSVAIIQKFSPLPEHVATLRKYEVRDEKAAAVTVTTVHRAKGLEWDTVRLHEDFQELEQPGTDNVQEFEEKLRDELNLLYVAATRARRTLILNSVLRQLLKQVPPPALQSEPASREKNTGSRARGRRRRKK